MAVINDEDGWLNSLEKQTNDLFFFFFNLAIPGNLSLVIFNEEAETQFIDVN